MKHQHILTAIAAFALFSCARSPRNLDPFGWKPVDHEFDSLTLRAERLLSYDAGRDSAAMPVEAMRRVARKHPESRVMDARATFFEGQLVYKYDNPERGDSLHRASLAMTDSARYPYDALRIGYTIEDVYHEPTLEYYEHLRGLLDGFVGSGDKFWSAGVAMETGMFLTDLGDTRHGEVYLDMADSLFRAGGFSAELSTNRINRANLLRVRKDTTQAVALMRSILVDTVNPISEFTRHIVLGNLYSLTGDTTALREAYGDVRHFSNSADFECLYASCLAVEQLKAGRLDSARHYRAEALRNLVDDMPAETALAYYEASQRMFEAEGRIDSAYRYLGLADDLRRRIQAEDDRAEINNVTLYSHIEEMRRASEAARRDVVVASLCVIFAILALAGVVALLVYRRVQRQKLAGVEAALARERSDRKALAMETVLAEKENMMRDMEREMQQMETSGEITAAAARKLGSSIRLHVSQREQRDSFLETFETLSPDFSLRLKEAYPALTESDIRLASYIAIGMESKHIARVMSIRPESVKQARWRLRGKMGLGPDDSLDDVIRRI